MILKYLCIVNLHTYRLNALTMVNNLLFFYCLLTSTCIKAALDNNLVESTTFDENKKKWYFLRATQNDTHEHTKNICYIAMIDKSIPRVPSVSQQICNTIISLQDTNIEEIHSTNFPMNIMILRIANLSGSEVAEFLYSLNLGQKSYEYAVVIIFTINGKDNKLHVKIEKIELYRTIDYQNTVSNSSSNELYTLYPLFSSSKRMIPVSKNCPHNNNAGSDEIFDTGLLLDYFDNNHGLDILNHHLEQPDDKKPASDNICHIDNVDCNKIPDINVDAVIDYFNCNNNEEPDILNKDNDIEQENNSVLSQETHNEKDISYDGNVIIIENTVNRKHECDICGDDFITQKKLRNHIKLHTKEKKYKCDLCDHVFKTHSNLRNHIMTHTGKPFKCDLCDNTFINHYRLNIHMFTHTNEKPFKCNLCFASYMRNDSLTAHMLNHTGGSRFKCSLCNKGFSRKDNLQRHKLNTNCLRVHHITEKPFKCYFCVKSYMRNASLQAHMGIHTDVHPFKCHLCNKAFSRKARLTKHQLNINCATNKAFNREIF